MNLTLDGQPVEILIAEDSPTQAQRLRHILEQQNYGVVACTNGREALETAKRRKPTMIISDVVMPEMDGYELCKRVKSDPAIADLPVILVTTLADPQDVIRGLECRADNFIIKPYDERYLLGRIQFVLVNRTARQSEQSGMGVEIYFNGHKHFITADRLQILNLLLSTYDAAIQRNKELSIVQSDLRRLNSDLEVANKELEAFSYSVSHDLRAPLRSVDGFSAILSQRYGAELPADAVRLLGNISDAAHRMGRLIDDLLSFSRLSRQELRRTHCSMSRLVEEVVQEMRQDAANEKVKVQIGELPDCQGDPSLLKQVLINLLSNAFKFSRTKDNPLVEVGYNNQMLEEFYFVRDNGAGFDMQYAGKLFGVFQRLHSEDQFEGTGIGLSIAQRIIVRHGGRIWANAEVGKGATFCFTVRTP